VRNHEEPTSFNILQQHGPPGAADEGIILVHVILVASKVTFSRVGQVGLFKAGIQGWILFFTGGNG